ncbi:MAG: DegQ family serine endoprotease [Deltaproteobacteria bacterium]
MAIAVLVSIFMLFSVNSDSYAFTEQEYGDIAVLDKTSKAFAAVSKAAMPAVAFVQVEKSMDQKGSGAPFQFQDPFEFFNDPFFERFFGPHFRKQQPQPRKFRQRGQGSGFIISPDGYLLTNNHVVEGADTIKVKLADGREFTAAVVGTDPQSDVAVIKVDGKNLPYLRLGDSDKLDIGEWVIAIGNPFGLQQTVTVGVVSAKGRSRLGINDYEDFIQTDAAINPGNSGGPLINIHGEVVGMNTAIVSRSGGYMGIGFAIPINMAKAIKDQLIASGKVTRGWLGVIIQQMDEDLAKSFGLTSKEGILVAEVTPDSPADKAGLKDGDVIIRMNGQKVTDVAELRNKIALMPPGTTLDLEIIRDGKPVSVTATIGEQPQTVGMGTRSEILQSLGFSVQELTPELAEHFGYPQGHGVLISEVDPDGLAAQIGMKPGQLIEEVNRQPVKNVREFMSALAASKDSKRVLLRVREGEFSRYVALPIK